VAGESRPRVILASGSTSRAAMLANAGVPFETDRPAVDEMAVKQSMKISGAGADEVAEALAATKAQQISRKHDGDLVIGADQVLVCGDAWFDKPDNLDSSARQLRALRGLTHDLVSAVCVVQHQIVIWHHVDRASMTMRPFTDSFLNWYLSEIGEEACSTVGGYKLEGLGAQLFSHVEGDYFTVLGMPLIPLLDFLRAHGVVPE
jgi:septum formation protein